jgi:Uma2 family endonuclease
MSAAVPQALDPERNAPEVEAAFEAVPPEMVAEILDGELFTFPRPAHPHTRSASRLGMRLGGPFDLGEGGPGGWVILDEPELHLGRRPDKLAPDLAAWRRERMPDALGDEETPAYYDVAPDWACEVISPRTERIDRGKKMRIYRREGVGHLWLLSPLLRTLEVYRLEGGRWSLLETYEDDEKVRAEPFDAVELDLASIWAR